MKKYLILLAVLVIFIGCTQHTVVAPDRPLTHQEMIQEMEVSLMNFVDQIPEDSVLWPINGMWLGERSLVINLDYATLKNNTEDIAHQIYDILYFLKARESLIDTIKNIGVDTFTVLIDNRLVGNFPLE